MHASSGSEARVDTARGGLAGDRVRLGKKNRTCATAAFTASKFCTCESSVTTNHFDQRHGWVKRIDSDLASVELEFKWSSYGSHFGGSGTGVKR
jgi:hypothetical protein